MASDGDQSAQPLMADGGFANPRIITSSSAKERIAWAKYMVARSPVVYVLVRTSGVPSRPLSVKITAGRSYANTTGCISKAHLGSS